MDKFFKILLSLLVILFLLLPGATIPVKAVEFPLAAAGNLESPVQTLTGWFNIVWGDPAATSSDPGSVQYYLSDGTGRMIRLVPGAGIPLSEASALEWNGKQIAVTGTWQASSVFEIASIAEAGKQSESSYETPALSGSQPWVSILCKFSDIPEAPRDLNYFQSMYSSSYPGMDHYWRELSYDLINVIGSAAFGWFTLAQPRSYYIYDIDGDGNPDADLERLFDDCTAAADPSVYYPNYIGINLMFNEYLGCCAWGGSWYATLDGVSKSWRTTWEPPWAYTNISVIAHEMGHGFGLPHSSGMYGQVYDNYWDVMSKDRGGCPPYDPTFGCIAQHTISYHKDRLGWFTPAQKFTAALNTKTTINLEQIALPQTQNYRMAQVPIGGSATLFYTVEARRQVGYDSKLPGNAVIIHEVNTQRNGSAPALVVDIDGNGDTGDGGAMWLPGESFVDSTNGVTVTVNSASATGFNVSIENKIPVFSDCNSQSQIPVIECQALVALYQATGGANWTNQAGWLGPKKPCEWFGVACVGGHVIAISLNNNMLAGMLPSELGDLALMDYLNLSSNALTGSIPATLGNRNDLQFLDLGDNQLSGEIPVELFSLAKLQDLRLSNNRLEGALPPGIGNLANLEFLRLENNAFSGEIPHSITNLISLIVTDVGYNALVSNDPGVQDFLQIKDPDWADTQTVPPGDLAISDTTAASIILSWTPIVYSADDGFYQVAYSETSSGPYTIHGATVSKVLSSYEVSGLSADTMYYFVVRSFTPAHDGQQNDLWSAYTPEISGSIVAELPGAFVKLSPADGWANQPPSLTLDWSDSLGAVSYEYCFDTTDDDLCSNWTSSGVTSSVLLVGLSLDTAYYWQVRAVNNFGMTYAQDSEQDYWSFHTRKDFAHAYMPALSR